MKLQIKRSNVLQEGAAKSPTVEQMEYGELAVYYNSTDPVLFIKDSNDNVIRLTNIQTIGDGAINLDAGTGLTASGDNATANQIGDTTRVFEIDQTWVADFVNANGNGGINVNAGSGLEASGSNATANQAGDTTRVLSAKIDLNGGLQVGGAGIAAVAKPGGGIVVDNTGISVDFPPSPASTTYGDGLTIDNNQVDLVLSSSNNGLNVDSDGISVRIDPGYAIDVTATGIRFGNNWSNIPVLPGA